jgi:glucose/arabinose dehydrogenase
VPFAGRPASPPEDILSGFVTTDGQRATGRRALPSTWGALLVADDVGNGMAGGAIWRSGALLWQ